MSGQTDGQAYNPPQMSPTAQPQTQSGPQSPHLAYNPNYSGHPSGPQSPAISGQSQHSGQTWPQKSQTEYMETTSHSPQSAPIVSHSQTQQPIRQPMPQSSAQYLQQSSGRYPNQVQPSGPQSPAIRGQTQPYGQTWPQRSPTEHIRTTSYSPQSAPMVGQSQTQQPIRQRPPQPSAPYPQSMSGQYQTQYQSRGQYQAPQTAPQQWQPSPNQLVPLPGQGPPPVILISAPPPPRKDPCYSCLRITQLIIMSLASFIFIIVIFALASGTAKTGDNNGGTRELTEEETTGWTAAFIAALAIAICGLVGAGGEVLACQITHAVFSLVWVLSGYPIISIWLSIVMMAEKQRQREVNNR